MIPTNLSYSLLNQIHMKQLILLSAACLLMQFNGFSQNELQLTIHHLLGEENFELEMGAQNNLGHDFKLHRLEYYLSEIVIIHDGGTFTPVEDVWILVNADEPTQVSLGSYAIDQVEGINIHIGVDPDHNHLDPASYPAEHPLAPKFPSMHWGWAAGYRFLALEGFGSSNYNQLIELHGLEDENYFRVNIPVTANAENGVVNIDIDADYTRALEDIEVNGGIIIHGGIAQAQKALENFRDYVFNPSATSTSSYEASAHHYFDVYPNPAADGMIKLELAGASNQQYQIVLTNSLGENIMNVVPAMNETDLALRVEQAGLYFITLIASGKPVQSKKVIVE
jgi:hypothetical protein